MNISERFEENIEYSFEIQDPIDKESYIQIIEFLQLFETPIVNNPFSAENSSDFDIQELTCSHWQDFVEKNDVSRVVLENTLTGGDIIKGRRIKYDADFYLTQNLRGELNIDRNKGMNGSTHGELVKIYCGTKRSKFVSIKNSVLSTLNRINIG